MKKENENGIHLIDLLFKHANSERGKWQELDKRIQFDSKSSIDVDKGLKFNSNGLDWLVDQ